MAPRLFFNTLSNEGVEKGNAATGERGRGGIGALCAPIPPLPAFLICTARRRKCVQQRKCRGDGASLVFLHPQQWGLTLVGNELYLPSSVGEVA